MMPALLLDTHKGLKNSRIFLCSLMLFYQNLYPRISKEQIYQQFGNVSNLFITYPTRPIVDNEAFTKGDCSGLATIPVVVPKPFANKFQLVTDLNTTFGGWFNRLHSVSCLTDEEIWTSDSGNHIRFFNLQGELKSQ